MRRREEKKTTRNVIASRLRKLWHRDHADWDIGDLIETPEGGIGLFQGFVSTHAHPGQITVFLRPAPSTYDHDNVKKGENSQLGPEGVVTIAYIIKEDPKVQQPTQLWGSRRVESFRGRDRSLDMFKPVNGSDQDGRKGYATTWDNYIPRGFW